MTSLTCKPAKEKPASLHFILQAETVFTVPILSGKC